MTTSPSNRIPPLTWSPVYRSGVSLGNSPAGAAPSTSSSFPVIHDDAGDAKNKAAEPMSSGVPFLRIGVLDSRPARMSGMASMNPRSASVSTHPGRIAALHVPADVLPPRIRHQTGPDQRATQDRILSA